MITDFAATFWTVDFPPLLAASLAGIACALVGNFLVLTKRAMAADALSHSVVPGVVIAALAAGTTATSAMLAGGLVAALTANALVGWLVRVARVEPGSALGVVFTGYFAAGILIMEWSGLARQAFDIHHIVTGQLETLIWVPPAGSDGSWGELIASLPPVIAELAISALGVAGVVLVFRRQLALLAFDAEFAQASGLSARLYDLALLIATALACLTAFRSVGVVLAVAMIVCPPATARLLTRQLGPQMMLSVIIALGIVFVGYGLAAFGPALFGSTLALNAAGVIGALAGFVLGATALAVRRAEAASVRARLAG